MDMRNSKEALLARVRELEFDLAQKPTKKERIYMQCLELSLKHCSGWSIGGKKINDSEGYCALAKAFADNSISKV